MVTNIAFDAFSCYGFADGAWLKVDVSVECGSPMHTIAKTIAAFAICLYSVGTILLNAVLLYRARHAIASGTPTSLSRSIAFLYVAFGECVPLQHRLILSAAC